MPYYCEEYDLLAERPNILGYGVNSWDDKILEASEFVTEDLELNWYRGAAENHNIDWQEYPFDPEYLYSSSRVKRLAVYKTLELAYRYLMKDAPADQDAFEHQSKLYAELYSKHLKSLCAHGVDYDWDASGGLDYSEQRQPTMRRLTRC